MPTKIGVIHTSLSGLNLRALKYLVLHQNSIQNSFEFQFLPFPSESEFLCTLDKGVPIDREETLAIGISFFEEYEQWLIDAADEYDLQHQPVDGYVVLSTAIFSDNYYLDGHGEWMMVALGNWQRSMSPPSIIEFILTLLADCAIGFACKNNYPSVHNSTIGCAFDFNASLNDARWSVLNGHICSSCKSSIQLNENVKLLEDSLLLLQRKWLGKPEEPTAVAAITKKLGYDLYHTTGVKQTLFERLKTTLEEEAVKNIFMIFSALIISGLLTWIGLK